jgi:alpha-glucosidase/lysosomal alpha-glucosidase
MEVHTTYKVMHDALNMTYPFILTRSNFAGVGKYTAHWTGDNLATWEFLRYSLPAMFNFGMFGIPMVGSDICGFDGETTPELCARWIQLGALYPFSRNHNAEGRSSQELHVLGPTVLETGRQSLKMRYRLLKYYFSLFLRKKGMVVRPIFFDFPSDDMLFNESIVNSQFMIGPALMATPVLYPEITRLTPYFPRGDWYILGNGDQVQSIHDKPRKRLVRGDLNMSAPLFIRGGHIIPLQDTRHVEKTADLTNEFQLFVGLTPHDTEERIYYANGFVMGINNFSDEAINAKCDGKSCLVHMNFTLAMDDEEMTLTFTPEDYKFEKTLESVRIKSLKLYGARLFTRVSLQDQPQRGLLQATLYPRKNHTYPDLNTFVRFSKLRAKNTWFIYTGGLDILNYSKIVIRPHFHEKSGRLSQASMPALLVLMYIIIAFVLS